MPRAPRKAPLSARRAALALVATVCCAARGEAAPDWTSPIVQPFAVTLMTPVFGFAADGTQLAARIDVAQPIDPNAVVTTLVVARKAPGAAWVDELSVASSATAVPINLDMAVAPSGAAVVVYAEGTSSDFSPTPSIRWKAAFRAADGTWETPVTLFADPIPAPMGISSDLVVAIANDGTALAGATHLEVDDQLIEPSPGQTDRRLDVAIRPAGGTWAPAQRLSAANQSAEYAPGAGVDDAGNFTVAWASRFSEGGTSAETDDRYTILVRRLLAGQSIWNTAEDVTGSDFTKNAYFGGKGLAVGADGRAVIAFEYGPGLKLWAATRPDSLHTFDAPAQLVTTGSTSAPAATAVAPDGTAFILYGYSGSSSSQDYVGLMKRPPGGAWTGEAPVSPLGLDASGGGIGFVGADAIAVWEAYSASGSLIQATRWRGGAATPESYRDLEPLGQASLGQAVSDRGGSVVAVWSVGTELRSAAYDGGGPVPSSVTLPSPLFAGVPASFGVTTTDLWSDVAGVPGWSFGDETAAVSGATVEHTYGAPGGYAIAITSADTRGNLGTATVNVTVAACESTSGLASLDCRCTAGLAGPSCADATLPASLTKRFAAACTAVEAAKAAGAGKKARKAATRAGAGLKKAGRLVRARAAKRLPQACRDELTAVLGAAQSNAAAYKGSL